MRLKNDVKFLMSLEKTRVVRVLDAFLIDRKNRVRAGPIINSLLVEAKGDQFCDAGSARESENRNGRGPPR